MWLPKSILDVFAFSVGEVQNQRQDLAALRAERDALVRQVATLEISGDWLRAQVNQLQLERVELLNKVYGIRVPAPQLIKERSVTTASQGPPAFDLRDFSFDDVGDEIAKKIGLPVYGDTN